MEEKLKKEISDQFDIQEWDSKEGIAKRQKIAKALKNASVNIGKALASSLTNREKAKVIRNYLKNMGWASGIYGAYKFVSGIQLNSPEFDIKKFSFDFSGVIELGPTFWLKVAVLLFLLRIVHKVVSSGAILVNDFSKMWNWVKNIFKENVANEGFVSIEEYRNLKLLID